MTCPLVEWFAQHLSQMLVNPSLTEACTVNHLLTHLDLESDSHTCEACICSQLTPLSAPTCSPPHSHLIVQQSHQNRRVPHGKNGHQRNSPKPPKTFFQLGVGFLRNTSRKTFRTTGALHSALNRFSSPWRDLHWELSPHEVLVTFPSTKQSLGPFALFFIVLTGALSTVTPTFLPFQATRLSPLRR